MANGVVGAKLPSDRGLTAIAALPSLERFAETAAISLGAIALSAFLFGLFIHAVGKSPIELYGLMYTGGFGTWFSWQNTLQSLPPPPTIWAKSAYRIPFSTNRER
jgi:simple sugar transport system permease protein